MCVKYLKKRYKFFKKIFTTKSMQHLCHQLMTALCHMHFSTSSEEDEISRLLYSYYVNYH